MKHSLPMNVEKVNEGWKIFSILGEIIFTLKEFLEDCNGIGIYAYKNFTVQFPVDIFEKMQNGGCDLSKKEIKKVYSLFSFVMWLICPTIATYSMNIEKVTKNFYKLHTPFQKIPMELVKKEEGKFIYSVLHFTITLEKSLDFYMNPANRNGKDFSTLESFCRWFDTTYKTEQSVVDSFSNYEGLYEQKMLVFNDLIATIPVQMFEINDNLSYAPFSIQYPIGNKPTTGLVFKNNEDECSVFINGGIHSMTWETFDKGSKFKDIIELKSIPVRKNLLFGKIFFNITKDNIMLLDCSNLTWKDENTIDWKNSYNATMPLFYYNFMENYYGKKELVLGAFDKEKRGYEVTDGCATRTGLHTSEIMRVNFKSFAIA